jgi:hypothetical protein
MVPGRAPSWCSTTTPSGSYTSPLPDKHAIVTLSRGGKSDFESLCASISRAATHSR